MHLKRGKTAFNAISLFGSKNFIHHIIFCLIHSTFVKILFRSWVVVLLFKIIAVKQTSELIVNFGEPSRGAFSAPSGTKRRTA